MNSQQELIDSLPKHLQAFARVQDYGRYSARDHAVWRYTMHQLVRRLRETAHPVYLEGLRRTGISLEHIPSMDEMNAALAQLDWRAVVVDGFIPPAIFMEFQARKILVIALDMRSIDHIAYTPAPDIVHESAGHAPFIIDIDYAEFLQRFGEIGMKAIASAEDQAVYEAIRHLSIVKEDSHASPQQIRAAEDALSEALEQNRNDSEASRLSRLHWWTVEYGLVGSVEDYRIFGAGLLSSLGESVNCLDDSQVRKSLLTVDAVDCPYDITREQPQLFVTHSCRHMSQILEEFAQSMSFMRGGACGLRTAIASGSVCTARYSSGLQVSGKFQQLLTDAVDNAIYIGTTGPTELAYADRQLPGHDSSYHAEGFGSPVGKLAELPQCLSVYSVDELKNAGIRLDTYCQLEFLSGISVHGRLRHIERRNHRNLLLSFEDCTVRDRHGQILFDPAWGIYDMAVGARIESVYGGAADRESFQLYRNQATTQTRPRITADAEEQQLMNLYAQLRRHRESGTPKADALHALLDQLAAYPDEWLIRLELRELLPQAGARLQQELAAIAQRRPETARLIEYGLQNPD